MNPDDYQKVKEIFQSVLDLNAEDRRTFLNEKCSHDPTILLEVQRLLDSYQPSYLEEPVGAKYFPLANDDELRSGQTIGRFTIVEKIGAGGMGEVYLAEDGKLGRQVAVKFLPDIFTNHEDRLRRFQQEARTASALNHPNILTIFDIDESENRHYIATEFIDGETLRERLYRSRQTIVDALDIAVQTASALAAAHEAGIVHRDIKPENIMLRRDGLVKVLDFGLAKLTNTENSSVSHDAPTERYVGTIPGLIMGTIQYMSPEQTRAQPTDVRTDIWSLGCVIYEMLSGVAPFRGDTTADLIAEIVRTEPEPLSTSMPDIPERLEEVIAKTLEKDPAERYQTVTDLLVDLKKIKRSLEIESELQSSNPFDVQIDEVETNGKNPKAGVPEKTSSVEYIVDGMKLHKRTAIGIVAGLVALVGGTAYVARTYWRNSNDDRFAYASKMKLAVQALDTSNLNWARQLLDDTKPKPGEEDLRGFEWSYLSQLHAERSAFQPMKLEHQGMVDAVAFSPDGNSIATGGADHTVRIWDVTAGNEITSFAGHTQMIISVAFSPDGTKLLSGSFDKTAKVWDIQTGRQILSISGSDGIGSLMFIPGGKKILGLDGSSLKIWDAVTGQEQTEERIPAGVGYPITQSANGRLFAAQDGDQAAVVWEAATGNVVAKVGGKGGFIHDLKFSTDSKMLLAGTSNGSVLLWDIGKKRELKSFQGHTAPVRDVTFSRDGKSIASGSEDDTIRVWDIEGGFEISTLKGHSNDVVALAFSPDGLKLASGSSDNSACIWSVPKNDGRGVLRGHKGAVESVEFSYDGKLLVSAGEDKTAKIWEVATERARLTLTGHAAAVGSAAFSPSGKLVATGSSDGKVVLWDAITGRRSGGFDSSAGVAKTLFSPDGKLIATAHFWDDPEVRVWDAATGAMRCTFRGRGAWDLEFSKDGKRMTTSDGADTVRLWNPLTCSEIQAFSGVAGDSYAAAFRHDGKLTAIQILNNGHSLALIDAETGKQMSSILGHSAKMTSAVLSPDSKRLVTSGDDSFVKMWDTTTGQELLSIKVGSIPTKVAFSRDGTILAAALADGTVRLWRSEGS